MFLIHLLRSSFSFPFFSSSLPISSHHSSGTVEIVELLLSLRRPAVADLVRSVKHTEGVNASILDDLLHPRRVSQAFAHIYTADDGHVTWPELEAFVLGAEVAEDAEEASLRLQTDVWVSVLSAHDLRSADGILAGGKSDPYVQLRWRFNKGSTEQDTVVGTTATVVNSLYPTWVGEYFQCPIGTPKDLARLKKEGAVLEAKVRDAKKKL